MEGKPGLGVKGGEIVAVTAPNRRNLGMYSVDRAAVAFFAGTGAKVAFRTLREHMHLPHDYGGLPVDDIGPRGSFRGAAVTVFWGDFTTSPTYGARGFRSILSRRHLFWRATGLRIPRKRAFAHWMGLFSPPHPGAGCHSFGQNFQIAPADPQMDRLFRATGFDPDRHLAGFASILARDSVSQERVNAVRGEAEAHVCDLAFLGRPPRPFPGPRRTDRTGRAGVLFKRSRLAGAQDLVARIALQHEVVDLSGWLTATPARIGADYAGHLDRIAACDIVVTDVYHLAINAILSGVPVLCLGTDDGAQRDPLSDFKKRILFRDIGAEGAYLSLPAAGMSAEAIWPEIGRRMAGARDIYDAGFADRLGQFIETSRRRMLARLGL